MRFKIAELAPAVDEVIAEQLRGLAAALGGNLPAARGEKAREGSPAGATDERPEPEKSEPGLDDAMADLLSDAAATGADRAERPR